MANTTKKTWMDALKKIQINLKAPKNQYNTFGKYTYRSCEDILNALKTELGEVDATIVIRDDLVEFGTETFVKATVNFFYKGDLVCDTTAFAGIQVEKKGMDFAQVLGATSSYARKYALSAMFLIDDSQDADTQDNKASVSPPKKVPVMKPCCFNKDNYTPTNGNTYTCKECGGKHQLHTLQKHFKS